VSHSKKSAAQRAKSLERLKAFRERAATPQTPSVPQHTASFDAAYSGNPITPEYAHWDDRGFMKWNGPVHTITYTPRRAYTPRIAPKSLSANITFECIAFAA
jgi:hypothetical protein